MNQEKQQEKVLNEGNTTQSNDIPIEQKQEQASFINQQVETLIEKHNLIKDGIIEQIKKLTAQVIEQEEEERELTAAEQEEKQNEVTQLTIEVLKVEKKLQILVSVKNEEISGEAAEQKAEAVGKGYEPTLDEISTRRDELTQNADESGWTDATDSQAGDDIWVVDDDIMNEMEKESEEESEEEEKMDEVEDIDYDELEDQFVTGGESEHTILFGKHEKFCVSLNGVAERGLFFSGGGDDYLHMYNLPKEQVSPETSIKPYHIVKHSETINKIEVSYNRDHIFTLTDNEVLCIDIKSQEVKALKEKSKTQKEEEGEDGAPICSDMACHHLGDVVAVANGFELEIFNIKGLKLFQTYYCEREIQMMGFTEQGKQLYLACDDHRIRLLTPKTSEFSLIAGVAQHKSEISAIKNKGDVIISGCIDGYIGVSSIKKSSMMALIGAKETEDLNGSINHLEFAGSYFIAGSSSDSIEWYDLAKTKKLFNNPLEGSSTSIIGQGKLHEHVYDVATMKGQIYLYDCRNPLKEIRKVKAGNTVHQLWSSENSLFAACEDGCVRHFDLRKIIV